jgi:hypothetical protein
MALTKVRHDEIKLKSKQSKISNFEKVVQVNHTSLRVEPCWDTLAL